MFVSTLKDYDFGLFICLSDLSAAASEVPSSPLSQVREQATNLCINILLSYRKFCATVSSSGQLILPEALKLLPLYTLGKFLSQHVHRGVGMKGLCWDC